MKKNAKNVILVLVIVTLLLGLLGGCCYYCCPPIEEWTPLITLTKPYCKFLREDLEPVTPWSLRYPVKEVYGFASLEDTQKAVYNVWGTGGDFVTKFLSQPGCELLPLAIAEHLDGTEEYVTAACDNGKDVVFYRISPSGKIEEMGPDYSITYITVH